MPLPAPFRPLRVLLIATSLPSLLAGCAATHVAISKRDLEVPSRMSDAVFLDPVGGDKRTAFVYVRNTSDRPDFRVETPLKSAIAGCRYRIVNDPEEAHFELQAQVLSVSRMSITAAEAALDAGYGGTIAGAAVGGVAGAATTGTGEGTAIGAVAGGIVGGIAETIANAAVNDVTCFAITDVQISEKAREGVGGRRDLQVDAQQGMGGSEQSTFTEETTEKRYRTRVIGTADKVNLQYEEEALLDEGLTRVLSGVFRATAPLPRQCRSAEERACLLPDRLPGQGGLDEMPAFPDPAAPGRERPRAEFTPARTASSDAGRAMADTTRGGGA